MLKYFVKRFLSIIPKILVISVLIFLGMQLIPVDPLTISMNPDQLAGLSEEQLDQMREEKGLNDPLPVQYFRWLGGLVKGDFGYSLQSGAAINELVAARFPATLELALVAVVVGSILAIFMGCISALFKNTPLDYTNTVLGLLGSSVPDFFFAMGFILIFAIRLAWLPTGGRMEVGHEALLDRIPYMVLPVICMAIGMIPYLMRLTRNSMLDVMNKDYVKTARAKGLSEPAIFVKHVFRNGCTPVVICLIGRLNMLVAGSMVIETVFSYPGMGMLMVSSITANDMSTAMICLFICALIVLLTTFLSDIATALLDPRVRFGKGE